MPSLWGVRAASDLDFSGFRYWFRRNRGSRSRHRAPPTVIRRLQSGNNSPSAEGT
jgi:hypothetical protein